METAAALDATKAAAEGTAIDAEVMQDQVARRKSSRSTGPSAGSRPRGTGHLDPLAVYDLELSNIPPGLGSATPKRSSRRSESLRASLPSGWTRREMLDLKRSAKRWAVMRTTCLAEIAGALGVMRSAGKLTEQADGRMMVKAH